MQNPMKWALCCISVQQFLFPKGGIAAFFMPVGDVDKGQKPYYNDTRMQRELLRAVSYTHLDVYKRQGEAEAEALAQMRKISEKIYHAVDASGLARVDFFMEKSGRVLFNELNTMPGFTSISMYPMLWEEEGMSKTELMDRLIALALERDNGIHG